MDLETKIDNLVSCYGFSKEEATQQLAENNEDILKVLKNLHNIKASDVKQNGNQAKYTAYRNIFKVTKETNQTSES